MIILVGMPCSGKSFYSKHFGSLVKVNNFDTDTVFTEKFQISPLNFIKINGWVKFREGEYSVLNEFINTEGTKERDFILATGGGIIDYQPSYKLLESIKNNNRHKIVYLDISIDNYIKRYLEREEKIQYKYEEMVELYNKRVNKFRNISDYSIDCNNLNNSINNLQELKELLN